MHPQEIHTERSQRRRPPREPPDWHIATTAPLQTKSAKGSPDEKCTGECFSNCYPPDEEHAHASSRWPNRPRRREAYDRLPLIRWRLRKLKRWQEPNRISAGARTNTKSFQESA